MRSQRCPPVLLYAILALALSGCGGARLHKLENQLKAESAKREALEAIIEGQTLRSESVAKGLDKLATRFNAQTPASAQWLKLEPGSTISWYLDEEAENVYVRFVEAAIANSVTVSVSTKERSSTHVMSPGEAVEHIWRRGEKSRSFIVTLHRIVQTETEGRYGYFSIVEGPINLQ